MIPVLVTYAYRLPTWGSPVIQCVTLEFDPACTRLHQVADMIGGPLVIGGRALPDRTVQSIEIGTGAVVGRRALILKSAPQQYEDDRDKRLGYGDGTP